ALFARVALSHRQTDGYYLNTTTGRPADFNREFAGDARIIYEANENLTFDLRGRLGRVKMGTQLWTIELPPLQRINDPNYFPDFQMNNNQPGIQHRTDLSLKMDYDMKFAVLTVTAAYNDSSATYPGDEAINTQLFTNPAAFLAANPPLLPGYSYALVQNTFNILKEEDESIEIRLASPSDQRLRWMGGTYYSNTIRRAEGNTKIDKGVNILSINDPRVLNVAGPN